MEHVSLSNPAAVGQALATIGPVSQEAIVESAGGSWPASTVDVVRSFWKLLEHAGVTKFHRAERLTGDAFRSEGSYENGRLWQCSSLARVARIAAEVRGPSAPWETHADEIFNSAQLLD